jgi:hypothetical protein
VVICLGVFAGLTNWRGILWRPLPSSQHGQLLQGGCKVRFQDTGLRKRPSDPDRLRCALGRLDLPHFSRIESSM